MLEQRVKKKLKFVSDYVAASKKYVKPIFNNCEELLETGCWHIIHRLLIDFQLGFS